MKAVRTRPEGGIVITDVPVPEPGPGEVLVKVAGAGLCHSDCLIQQAPSWFRADGTGFTLGHETAGTVAALGAGVQTLGIGQPVIVHAEWGCGQCPTCRSGAERMCRSSAFRRRGAGIGWRPGRVPPRARRAQRDRTARRRGPRERWSAGRRRAHALPRHSHLGALARGGLVHRGDRHRRARPPRRTDPARRVLDHDRGGRGDERRRAFALELGADLALDPADDAAAQIKAMGRNGASLVLDLVGNDQTLAIAAGAAAERGKVVCVGAGLGSYPFSVITVPWECVLQTSYSGEAWELEQLLPLVASGKVRVEATHITLDEVPTAYARLDRGEHGLGRTIAIP
jgi:propanol-preferring alcohol dehydrogenase